MNCECGQNKFTENVRCAGCRSSSGRSFSAVVVEVKSGDTIPQIPFIPVDRVQSCTGRQFLFWPGCLIVLRVSLYRTRESLAPAIAIFGDGQRIKTATTTRSLSLSLWWPLLGHCGTPMIIILGFSFQLAKRALIANVPCSQIPRLRVHHWFIPRNVKEPPN